MPVLRKRAKTNGKIKLKQQTLIKKIDVRFKKQNLITKSKKRQIKLKINKITCNSPEIIGYSPVHNKAW